MGAQAEILPIDQFGRIVAAQATQAAQVFGRNVAGVDIMFDKNTGEHYFLEVNRAPQIEHASFETEKADWIIEQISHAIASHQPASVDVEPGMIGRFEHVVIETDGIKLPRIVAKVDTGADSSSIHAENIEEKNGHLHFSIAGKDLSTDTYFSKKVRSTTGHQDDRYYVTLPIFIGNKAYQMKTTLSNRSSMTNEMLIGRRFLREHHLKVDVSRRFILSSANSKKQEV